HGNEVYPAAYPNAEIITNQITREAMATKGLKRIQDHVRQGPGEIAQLKADLAAAGGGEARATRHGLRPDDEALPARPGDPSAVSGSRAHRGRRLRLPAQGESRRHGR